MKNISLRSCVAPLLLLGFLQCSNDETTPISPDPSLAGQGGAGLAGGAAGSAASAGSPVAGSSQSGQAGAAAGRPGATAGSDQTGGQTPAGQAGSDQAGAPQAGSSQAGQAGSSGSSQAGAAGQSGSGQAGNPGSAGLAGAAGQAATAGAAGQAGTTGAKDCPTDLPGSPLVRLAAPDGTPYCIERFEVSQSQYATFLAAKGTDTSGQPDQCAWNTSFTPTDLVEGGSTTGCPVGTFDPKTKGALPMVCADWCDAKAYCAWAGKRLCGKIGGGSVPAESFADAKVSQWQNACSQGGKTAYPYGDSYEAGRCVDGTNKESPGAAEAAGKTECHGQQDPFAQIDHLSGNVQEWEDSCQKEGPGGGLSCQVRGGDFSSEKTATLPRCDDNGICGIAEQNGTLGFRCCLDL
jgi:formylglycine-generating enzyme required for sulfatase activity